MKDLAPPATPPAVLSDTSITVAAPPAPPATVKPRISAQELIIPGAAGSAWLASIGLAVSQGVSLPLLAAIGAAGLASAAVVGKSILQRVGPGTPKPVDSAMSVTHLSYATNTALDDNLRIQHAYQYVRAVAQIPAEDAVRLFAFMPQGMNWGIRKKPFRTTVGFTAILKSIGLTGWSQNWWTPYDIETTIVGLSKLGPVTDDQRARIERDAKNVVRSFNGREGLKSQFRADLEAAVFELCRRAPRAETTTGAVPTRQ